MSSEVTVLAESCIEGGFGCSLLLAGGCVESTWESASLLGRLIVPKCLR